MHYRIIKQVLIIGENHNSRKYKFCFCLMFIIRYFDNAEKRCMPFYYGGCEGNDNRFDTFEECQKSCPSAFLQADVCQQPLVSGECGDYLER